RPVRGALALVRGLCKEQGCDVVLPAANAAEVSFLNQGRIFPFKSLRDVVQWLQGEGEPDPVPVQPEWAPCAAEQRVDLAEVKGQALAKRALEIAAAGNHNLAMIGCPGTGKSMLAQALGGILPAWTLEEALE